MSDPVRERKNAAQRERNARYRAEGRCGCGRECVPGRKGCEGCMASQRACAKRRYERQRERLCELNREYQKRPEARALAKTRRERERVQQPDKVRARERRGKYLREFGLTPLQVLEMHIAQDGACAICKRKFTDTGGRGEPGLGHVDHCHETGVVRGLLCVRCNTGLGHLEKWMRTGLLPQMWEYLERHGP